MSAVMAAQDVGNSLLSKKKIERNIDNLVEVICFPLVLKILIKKPD